MMEATVAVVVAAILAGGAGWALGIRRGTAGGEEALRELARDLEKGGVRTPGPGDSPAMTEVRRVVSRDWTPRPEGEVSAGALPLLGRVTGYLKREVAGPLEEGLRLGGPALRARARAALDAVEDLTFHADVTPVSDRTLDNVTRAVQEVIREYTSEFDSPVRLRAPGEPVRAPLDPEAFKDALYMVLVNAGRFGGGEAVEISVEATGREARILVRDRGPGFSREALERGLEPFYSTDPGALGLGLTHVRQVVMAHGGDLRLRNREEGGGEVEIVLPLR